jgi:hypothetical protein
MPRSACSWNAASALSAWRTWPQPEIGDLCWHNIVSKLTALSVDKWLSGISWEI